MTADIYYAILVNGCMKRQEACYQLAEMFDDSDVQYSPWAMPLRAILSLTKESREVNRVSVLSKIKALGGNADVEQIHNALTASHSLGEFNDALLAAKELATEAKFASLAKKALGQLGKKPIDLVLSEANREMSLILGQDTSQIKRFSEVYEEVLDGAQSNQGGGLVGVPTGIYRLDQIIGGIQPSDFVSIAAYAGVGKTTLALSIASFAAKEYGLGVLYMSIEMPHNQLVGKLLAKEALVDSKHFRRKVLNNNEMGLVRAAADRLKNAPFWLSTSIQVHIDRLTATIRSAILKHNPAIVFVDHMHVIHSVGSNKEQQVSYISHQLMKIAKDTGVPVVALAQLNRGHINEKRPPRLSDLRDSGSIEQDSDMVFLLHRPTQIGFQHDEAGRDMRDITVINVAKNRFGDEGTDIPCLMQYEYGILSDPPIDWLEPGRFSAPPADGPRKLKPLPGYRNTGDKNDFDDD